MLLPHAHTPSGHSHKAGIRHVRFRNEVMCTNSGFLNAIVAIILFVAIILMITNFNKKIKAKAGLKKPISRNLLSKNLFDQ